MSLDFQKVFSWFQKVFSWLEDQPWLLAPACYLAILLLLFWLRPLWLLKLDKVLEPVSALTVPVVKFKLSLQSLVLLKHHPHVLDAWVARNLSEVGKRFSQRETVQARKEHVQIQASLIHGGKKLLVEPQPKDLREVFSSKLFCLLIHGEGGTGKTSLAFQIARWSMESSELCRHRMLPVLVDQELDEGPRSFEEAIRGQLEHLTAGKVPLELLAALLRHRRVLVIVDHLSEMSERTRQQIKPGKPDFPVHALIVTSRIAEEFPEISKSTLMPLRIERDRLLRFMEAYLTLRGKRGLLKDADYFEACRRLVLIVGQGGNVTVLLARMYADQLIETLESNVAEERLEDSEKLPGNTPELMLCYINKLNRGIDKDSRRSDQEVQHDAEWVAWECLKEAHYPMPARREAVLHALATHGGNAEARLKYLEERLRLIQTIEPGDKLRFALDPLAEYLAGLCQVEELGADEDSWRRFLEEAEARRDAQQRTQGFLLAIRACYLARIRGATEDCPVPVKLARLANLDVEELQRAKRRQRIRRLISDLELSDVEERLEAVGALGRMGEAAREAVPALMHALENDFMAEVRCQATEALGQMGEAAREAVPALTHALEKDGDGVRAAAARALGQMGEAAREVVPALIHALEKDSDAMVRCQAAGALGQTGRAAREVVLALMHALEKDSVAWVREAVARALGRMGEAAREAAPALMHALEEDSDAMVRLQATEALEQMGNAAREAVPALEHIH